jgi:hypothetical protein
MRLFFFGLFRGPLVLLGRMALICHKIVVIIDKAHHDPLPE